jgi:D-alanyl-D-alanine carboxypeptidase/D-alanyl-D-alanine-endopeptidase (penicillin-binding protein 4)
MRNAGRPLTRRPRWQRDISRSLLPTRAAFACCILNLAFAAACARHPPPVTAPPLPASARTLSALQSDLLALTRSPGVQRGAWGIVVESLDRQERLFELNPRTLLVPASVAKLVSVATAVDAVGWDYTWDTRVGATGTIADGVLQGDLIVSGTGDPGARGDGDAVAAIVNWLKASAVTRIEGRIIGDDNALEEPRPSFAWAWDDLGYPTGALYGALNVGENKTVVTIEPGSAAGNPARLSLDASSQGRPLINRSVTGVGGSPQLLWPEQRPGEPALTIAGSIPVGAAPVRLMVSAGNPTLWFATVLRNAVLLAGIEVTGPAVDIDDIDPPAGVTTLYVHRSQTLGAITQPMLKESINLYAEAAMRLNAPRGPRAATNDDALNGFNARMQSWGIPRDGFQMVDGSGLSRRDVLAPDTLLGVLRRMFDASGTSPWMRALPLAGADGSLENRMKGTPAERNVRAKTGTMSNIRSLAGYVTTAGGEHLAFVVMLNDFEGSGAQAVQAIDAIAVRLATFQR